MSIQTYSVDRFIGLNQSGDENLMSPACTPDAANMCTDGGELRVAYGFTRLFEAAVPGTLRITARTMDGEIMAVEHREFPVYGVQFHPESIMTPQGKLMIQNFLNSY